MFLDLFEVKRKEKRKDVDIGEEGEEEYLIRPTRELERFLELFDKSIGDLSRLQVSGVFYMSPRVRWFYDTTILVLKSWSMFSKQYRFLLGEKKEKDEFFMKVLEDTRSVTGLEPDYQFKVVVKFLAFVEEVYRTAYSTLQVLWTGLYWFMTQGKVELRYVLQPYLGSKGPVILPTFGEGEEK